MSAFSLFWMILSILAKIWLSINFVIFRALHLMPTSWMLELPKLSLLSSRWQHQDVAFGPQIFAHVNFEDLICEARPQLACDKTLDRRSQIFITTLASHLNKFIRCYRSQKLDGFDVRSRHFSTWCRLFSTHCNLSLNLNGFGHVALKLCSSFRSLDTNVTMRHT